jgi:uncharacterized protein YciI
MNSKLLFFALLIFTQSANAQTENPKYDKTLAESLGGDEYGMKSYVLVILKTGPNQTKDKKLIDSLFNGHMENIVRQARNGTLIVAGPLAKNAKEYRGIFIFNVKSISEARAFLESDPAIKENLLEAELYNWYGSAALPTYLPNHEKVEKKKF